jgi:prepilin-type N-terminal cleavage/methylation domain-containing protein
MIRKGFTLVEVLVVIAIIGIVAAILFPVFASAKKSTKLSTDLQSVRQLGVAVLIYGGDYDDRVVPAVADARYVDGIMNGWSSEDDSMMSPPWQPLGKLLHPYVKSDAIFKRVQDKPRILSDFPKAIPRSEFLSDEISGLRGRLLTTMPPISTMLYGDVPQLSDAKLKTPCLAYSMSVKQTPRDECASRTAWLSDQ